MYDIHCVYSRIVSYFNTYNCSLALGLSVSLVLCTRSPHVASASKLGLVRFEKCALHSIVVWS
jgi:hypothetical protein